MRLLLLLALTTALAFPQRWGDEQTIRARITGGGGDSGKCTAEVEVDGVAEVAIMGDTGRIRTLEGQPARWRRLECSAPLPRNPREFKFRGIDGRGRQDLIRDARNGGIAAVRIQDPKGGSEGYTFDIEWRGGDSSRGGAGGWGDSGSGGWDRGSGSGSGWGSGGASGWGSGGNAQGGWNNSWGNDISYRGRGNGNFDRDGGPRYDISGVDVRVDRRSGQVDVALDTNDGRGSLTFAGRVQRVDGDTIHVNIDRAVNRGDSVNASATMRIGISGNRRVRSIDLDGRIGGNRSSLNWRD